MKRIFSLLMSLIFFCTVTDRVTALDENRITITILYDNYTFSEGLKEDWGFSCIVEGAEKVILFDTGTKSDILFYNIDRLHVDPKNVELTVITHNHSDHTGGLFSFLSKNNKVSVYLPISFPEEFFERVEKTKARAIAVKDPVEICEDVFLTGEMGDSIKEQSMILNTSQGLVIITGCSHQGIVNILERAREMFDRRIYLVFGGFHLLRHSESEVKGIISRFKELGVLKVGATHCTGDKAIELFREAYGENFVRMGVGKVVSISE